MAIVDVTEYGADPAGQLDSLAAVQTAAAALSAGDTLLFPPGRYWTRPKSATQMENFVTIATNDVFVTGPATVSNFMFNVAGSYGSTLTLLPGQSHSDTIDVASDVNTVSPGQYVQLRSAVNAYSAAAASFQGGSRSPATGKLYPVRFSEIHRVREVKNHKLWLEDDLLFPEYGDARKDPDRAADVPELIELQMVARVHFSDLEFDMTEHRYFRTIRFRTARDCSVSRCTFRASDSPGRHINATDSLGIKLHRIQSSRNPSSDARGSSWNSFVFGAGCQDIEISECRVFGDWQAIDFTSYGDPDFGAEGSTESHWRTTQLIKVTDCLFTNCHDAITTHPGTYAATIRHNRVRGSTNGIRLRSRDNIVFSNTLETLRTGITMSAFFNDSHIRGNVIRRAPRSDARRGWDGILLLLTSQEAMTNNAIDNVQVESNVIVDSRQASTSSALRAMHDRNIAQTMTAAFDAIRSNSCSIAWTRNSSSLPVSIGPHVHGIVVGD